MEIWYTSFLEKSIIERYLFIFYSFKVIRLKHSAFIIKRYFSFIVKSEFKGAHMLHRQKMFHFAFATNSWTQKWITMPAFISSHFLIYFFIVTYCTKCIENNGKSYHVMRLALDKLKSHLSNTFRTLFLLDKELHSLI